MSEVEKSVLLADADKPAVEAAKTDYADKSLPSAMAVSEHANIIPENTTISAKEVATSTLNAPVKVEYPREANDTEAAIEEISSITAATDITTNKETIIDTIVGNPKDASVIQKPAVEIKDSTKVAQSEATPRSANEEEVNKSQQNVGETRSNNATSISKLEVEMQKRTMERDSYRKKLGDTEKKLAILQIAYDAITSQDNDEKVLKVEQLRNQLVQTALLYEERNRVIANQEKQINALNNQVISLKEVISITRDLLQIRNMEVKQLQHEVDSMETKITKERDRYNAMISKMDAATRLNADLKKEYETQLHLFQSLREKYGEKINLLSEEKRALEAAASGPE